MLGGLDVCIHVKETPVISLIPPAESLHFGRTAEPSFLRRPTEVVLSKVRTHVGLVQLTNLPRYLHSQLLASLDSTCGGCMRNGCSHCCGNKTGKRKGKRKKKKWIKAVGGESREGKYRGCGCRFLVDIVALMLSTSIITHTKVMWLRSNAVETSIDDHCRNCSLRQSSD